MKKTYKTPLAVVRLIAVHAVLNDTGSLPVAGDPQDGISGEAKGSSSRFFTTISGIDSFDE